MDQNRQVAIFLHRLANAVEKHSNYAGMRGSGNDRLGKWKRPSVKE